MFLSVGITEDSVGYNPWVLAGHYICLSEWLRSFPSWLIKFSFHLTTFFGECFDWSTFKRELINLGSKLKSRTDRYDFSRKIRTVELPCETQLWWCNLWESDWTVSAPSVGSQSNHFILSFSVFGYLTCKPSSSFILVGLSSFSRGAAGAWQRTNLWGSAGESSCVRKADALVCVVSISDAMVAPPGAWNLALCPGLLSEPQPVLCHV